MMSRFVHANAFVLAGLAGIIFTIQISAAEPPPKPVQKIPSGLARQWRFIAWDNEFTGIGLKLFTLAIQDEKVVLLPPKDALEKRNRTVSDVEYADGILRFKLTYDAEPDRWVKDQPLRIEWFEGRYDPKFPDRLWGVLGPKDPSKDDAAYSRLRAAELNSAPLQPEKMVLKDLKTGQEYIREDFRWEMPNVMSPGLGAVDLQLNDLRRKLEKGPLSDNERMTAVGQFWALKELAANRKPNRRGYFMLHSLVRHAHLASVHPEEVSGWLGEILDYAAPYGPRFMKPLRLSLAKELEDGREEDYKPLIEKLRSDKPFSPTKTTKP
jgi:hypothetical protein